MSTRIIHMFWHGAPLTRIERLAMRSFVAHGHIVHLHVYEEPRGVPSGVHVVDASATLPQSSLFRHERSGSIAAFADWFRYRLLFEQGGIWADTDVVCLRPFDYLDAAIFGRMDQNVINNAVLGLAPGHPLASWMIRCCESPNRWLPYDTSRVKRRKLKRFLQGNRRGNIEWGETGPNGFTLAARHLGVEHQALPFWHFYPVHYLNWRAVFDDTLAANPQYLGASYAVHLWNEMARREPNFDKNARFPANSLFERLCAQHGIH